jgi:DNA repair protein RadA/Sms
MRSAAASGKHRDANGTNFGANSRRRRAVAARFDCVSRSKMVFRCTQCGFESPKWLGRCSDCGGWNTLQEEAARAEPASAAHRARAFRLPDAGGAGPGAATSSTPLPLAEIKSEAAARRSIGISELDRVLGGGLVPGSLILVGGDPGIGKSTLLLQALARIARPDGPALYVSGEESPEQVKLRATRLGISGESLLLLAETRADLVTAAIERARPAAVVIDSVQTIYDPEVASAPGSVSQVREVAARFLYQSKSLGIPTFLVGHVTKSGELAGPRVLEHMVDTVLYFESSGGHPYRILRAHKNRFGSTNEIGVFEMRGAGLEVVHNPSELFLAERPEGAPGSVVFPAIEGSRPVLVEVQALVSKSNGGTPRRTCLGFDSARAAMLVAVLERRAHLDLRERDIFVNVAGGMSIEEPAADLAVAVALASSFKDQPVTTGSVLFGEIGLAGEIRAVAQTDARLAEAAKLGFVRAILPEANLRRAEAATSLDRAGVTSLAAALTAAFR